MAGPWEAYAAPATGPWAAYQPQVGAGEDVLRSIPADIKGAASLFGGWPGDIAELGHMVANYMGSGSAPGQSLLERADTAINEKLGLPKGMKILNPLTSADITEGLDTITGGPSYQPQTNIGKDIKLGAELLPTMLGGPEAVATKFATRVAGPVFAAEGGGQIAKGLGGNEDVGRAAGMIAGGPGVALAEGARLRRAAKGMFPATEELHTAATQHFQAAGLDNVHLTPSSYFNFAKGLNTDLRESGFNPALSPQVTGVAKDIFNRALGGKPLTVLDVEHIRQQANNLYKVGGDSRALAHKFANVIVRHIDKYTEGLSPRDIVAGDAQTALSHVKQARNLWSRFRKAQSIDNMVTLAEDAGGANYSQAGIQASLRQQARALLKRITTGKEVGWTKQETAALRRVARGDAITNTTRWLGKLAPHGPVSMMSGLGLGAMGPGALLTPLLGPLGPVVGAGLTAGGSELMHKASAALALRNIHHARDVAAAGGKLAALPKMVTPQSLYAAIYGAAPALSQP